MVLEIRISNFFSIREEVRLDFRAAPMRSAQARALEDNVFQHKHLQVLKTVVIYGANASGKSNIIKAIRFCHAMVLESHLHNENTLFNFLPFKFDGLANQPSNYFIRFVIDGIEYEYAFSLTRQEIVSESLHYYPNGRIKEIFSRNERRGKAKRDIYTFGKDIRRPFDVAESTSVKTLYISRASQMDRDIAKTVYRFFYETFILQYLAFGVSAIEDLSKENKAQFIEALKIADSDIVDVKIKKLQQPGKNINANLTSMTLTAEDVVHERLQITTYHRRDPARAFDFLTEESQGTIKLFFMMLTILDIVKQNKILLVDEIEESLHPNIIAYIFNLFRASDQAQLLCTTHNTRFLDLKRLRKDQIYFVNKKDSGASDLYSLYDYSDFRETMDLEKAYLQGRFDAVPYVSDSEENIHRLLHAQAE
ncbi:MAG: ATP-binding protein [Bacteroidia bacterium]